MRSVYVYAAGVRFPNPSEILLGTQPPRTPGVLVPVTQTDSADPQQTRRALCHQWHVTGPRFLVSSWSGFRFLRPFVRFLRGGSISAAQTLTSSPKVARRSQRGASDARVERKRGGSWAYVWSGRQLNRKRWTEGPGAERDARAEASENGRSSWSWSWAAPRKTSELQASEASKIREGHRRNVVLGFQWFDVCLV